MDLPVLGPLLYRLNVNRPLVRLMARGHVYADPGWLRGGRLAAKLAVTRAPGARHASARFVAGALDPVRSREEFLALAGRVADPVLVVYGLGAPPKSRAEMEALAALPNVRAAVLPAGKLAVHEEFPDAVVEAARPFLAGDGAEGRSDRETDLPGPSGGSFSMNADLSAWLAFTGPDKEGGREWDSLDVVKIRFVKASGSGS